MAERQLGQQTLGRSPLMTAHEVAYLLQVSLRTVRRLIAGGGLPVVRIGRSVRVTQEALHRILSEPDKR